MLIENTLFNILSYMNQYVARKNIMSHLPRETDSFPSLQRLAWPQQQNQSRDVWDDGQGVIVNPVNNQVDDDYERQYA